MSATRAPAYPSRSKTRRAAATSSSRVRRPFAVVRSLCATRRAAAVPAGAQPPRVLAGALPERAATRVTRSLFDIDIDNIGPCAGPRRTAHRARPRHLAAVAGRSLGRTAGPLPRGTVCRAGRRALTLGDRRDLVGAQLDGRRRDVRLLVLGRSGARDRQDL